MRRAARRCAREGRLRLVDVDALDAACTAGAARNLRRRAGVVADDRPHARPPTPPPSGAPSANALPRRGLPPPLLACAASAGASDLRPERLEHREQRPDVAGARDLEQARWDDPRDFGAVGEHDLAPRPRRERLAREVRADRTEVLGRGHRCEAERHAAGRRVARRTSPAAATARRAPCGSPRSATARSR